MANDDIETREDSPQRSTSGGFKAFFGILIALLVIAIILLASGVVKMSPIGGP
ncbi:hypothetical protein ACUXST_002317 [Sphingomonas sp. F9_3S_D5_B_2]